MVGALIKVTVNDKPIQAAIARVIAKDGGLVSAVLKNVGEALVASTRARFNTQTDPDGQPWKPLNPEYAKGKKNPKILTESGQLGNSIIYQLTGTTLAVGTNKIYAAAQQFGATIVPVDASALRFRLNGRTVIAKKVTLPARPYLGISAADREEVIAIAEDHVLGAWSGG